MCLTFKKNNKQTNKPVNHFLQDDASAGIRSLKTSIEIKLCQNPWNGLCKIFTGMIGSYMKIIQTEITFGIKASLECARNSRSTSYRQCHNGRGERKAKKFSSGILRLSKGIRHGAT